MPNFVNVDYSSLTPDAVRWLKAFGRSLTILGSFFVGVSDGENDHDFYGNLQNEWPKDTRAGREPITELIDEMAGTAGLLATGCTPDLQQTFVEIALVLKRAYFAMTGEDTWDGDAFEEWLKKQEVEAHDHGADMDTTGTVN